MSSSKSLSDLEILEQLRDMLYEAIVNDESQPKVGDLMKVIELKRKLAVTGQAEKKFWDMINTIREEGLGSKARKTKQKSATRTIRKG